MSRRFTMALFFVAVLLPVISLGASIANDRCSFDRLEKCSRSFMYFALNDSIPEDANELEEVCRTEAADLKCLKDFEDAQCMKGISFAVFKGFREGITDEHLGKCDLNSPRRQDYDRYIPCINRAGKRISLCMRILVQKAESVGRDIEKKYRIPHGCCSYNSFLSCVKEATDATCDSDHTSYVEGFLNNIAGPILSTTCESYPADSCGSFPKLTLRAPEARTFMVPLISAIKPLG